VGREETQEKGKILEENAQTTQEQGAYAPAEKPEPHH
jgi:hypothetical protein